jgi:hypothetical protein
MQMDEGISGGCACGAVRYEAGNPTFMMNCHCRDCQRATGSGFAPTVVVTRASVRIQGELRYYERAGDRGKTVRRGFCPSCGSPVAGELAAVPEVIFFYAASLDDPSRHQPTMDIFTASAQPWDHMSADTNKVPGGIAK